MNRLLPISVMIVLGVASMLAIRVGMADEAVAGVNGQMNAIAAETRMRGVVPASANMKRLDDQMASAIQLAPSNGLYELSHLRLLRTSRQTADGVVAENLPAAFSAAKRAVVLLPASPYAWAEYALVADRLNTEGALPGGMAEVSRAMLRAIQLGPREPTVASAVLDIGLANGGGARSGQVDFQKDARDATAAALKLLALVAPQSALEVAARRGELSWLCQKPEMSQQSGCKGIVPAA